MAQGRELTTSEETYLVNKSNLFATDSRFSPGYVLNKVIHTEGVDRCLLHNDGVGLYNDYRGIPVIGVYRWLPAQELCILTEIDQSEAFAPIVAFGNTILGIGVAVAVIVGFLALYFARVLITTPMSQLTQGVEEIGQGNLAYRIKVKARNECGQLAAAFNDMAAARSQAADALQRAHDDLERKVEQRTADLTAANKNLQMEIADRKQKEEALRENKALYASLVNLLPQNLYRIDLEGRITFINQSLIESLGVLETEILGNTAYDFYPPDLAQKYRSDDQEVIVSGQPLRLIEENIDQDTGKRIFVDVLKIPIFADDGQVIGIQGVFEDITERKQAEEAVERGRKLLAAILATLPVGVCLTDETGHYQMMNDAYHAIYKYDPEEMIGQHYSMIMPPDQIAMVNAHYAQLLNGDTSFPAERKRQRKDGSNIYIEAANVLVEDVDGKKMVITTTRDITERKRASKQITSLLHEKELLLKETHHRIKNNMMVVSSLLSRAASRNMESDKQYKTILNNAVSQVRSMMILYDKLYRSENFRDLSIHAFLPPLIDEIMSIFRADLSVRTEITVDDFVVNSKTLSSLGIIINELIANSMKYAFRGLDNGLIYISAAKTNSLVTVVYEDNGVGFPESISVENSPGFGMQLIEMLVQQIGGSIQKGKGDSSRFVIEFELIFSIPKQVC